MSTSTDLASRLKEAVDAKARLEARLEERDEAHLEKVVLLGSAGRERDGPEQCQGKIRARPQGGSKAGRRDQS